jgi:hypothetical protein
MSHYIKYCRSEHNITKGCKYIQIGTSKYYQNVENSKIRDQQEGKIKITYTAHDDVAVTKPSKNIIGVDIGSINAIKGTALCIEYNLPIVYMFCCSLVENPSNNQAREFDYDDFYEIADIEGFTKIITEKILEVLKKRFWHSAIVQYLGNMVDYRDKGRDLPLSNETLLAKDNTAVATDYFVKPKVSLDDPTVNFISNSEFRIIWVPYRNKRGELCRIKEDPIMIQSSCLLPFVK